MCMFIYLFVVYFSFAPVISAITHLYCELFYIQVLTMVIITETLTSTSHHDIFTYLDYIFSCYLHIYIYVKLCSFKICVIMNLYCFVSFILVFSIVLAFNSLSHPSSLSLLFSFLAFSLFRLSLTIVTDFLFSLSFSFHQFLLIFLLILTLSQSLYTMPFQDICDYGPPWLPSFSSFINSSSSAFLLHLSDTRFSIHL